ncbi:MAG: phosphopentomutase [Deltaproteobacteria bacterium]|nr:phosphopentomutase [Deltaproteobacteria bacterium]
MKNFSKVILITLDSVGVGALPDAKDFGDENSNTVEHVAKNTPHFSLPHLEKIGLGLIPGLPSIKKTTKPIGFYGKCREKSAGKDTTSGHWEIAGVIIHKPQATFPNGFPKELIEAFKKESGVSDVLGNYPESGTIIIEKLGQEHLKTGYPIIYTSADSVFQIAAHENIFPLEKLYELCEKARKLCNPYNIGRVIARPFVGEVGSFTRTPMRKDFSLLPPQKTVLDCVSEGGKDVIAIGKTSYIFAERGITESIHTTSNEHGMKETIAALKRLKEGLIFTNLVDFDTLYGHRRDVSGYAQALQEFDIQLGELQSAMDEKTILMLTADHGCDPTYRGTDHTREYVPILVYSPAQKSGKSLGVRESFSDIGKTIMEVFKIDNSLPGKSFLEVIQ